MGLFTWLFKKPADEKPDGIAQYHRSVDRLISVGWMRWEFTPPPRDWLVRVCRPGEPGEKVLMPRDLPPEANIAEWFWAPWQGQTIEGDHAASRPVAIHSSVTGSGIGFLYRGECG